MKIDSLTSYNNSNKYQNRQTFGKLIIGEQTMERASRLVNPSYADSVQSLGKYYKCNLKEILGYDNATPDKKKILDSIFAKMPKEEVEDLTLHCEASNKLQENNLNRVIDIVITADYPEPMSVYGYKTMLHILNSNDKSGNFLYEDYIENQNRINLERIRKDGISMNCNYDTVPLPTKETVYKSIEKMFNDKYLGGTKDNAKITLKLPAKEDLYKLVTDNHHNGIQPEQIDNWFNGIQFAKPTLEHYSQSYNIEIIPSNDSWNKVLKVIIKSKKSSDSKAEKMVVTHHNDSFGTPEYIGTSICNAVKTWTNIIEKEEACTGNSYYYEIHPKDFGKKYTRNC